MCYGEPECNGLSHNGSGYQQRYQSWLFLVRVYMVFSGSWVKREPHNLETSHKVCPFLFPRHVLLHVSWRSWSILTSTGASALVIV